MGHGEREGVIREPSVLKCQVDATLHLLGARYVLSGLS